MREYLPFIFLLIVLKVPVIGAMYLLFWASKEEPIVDDAYDEGGDDNGGRRPKKPVYPIGPRRDPHGGGARRIPEPAHEGRSRQPAKPAVARSLERPRSSDSSRK